MQFWGTESTPLRRRAPLGDPAEPAHPRGKLPPSTAENPGDFERASIPERPSRSEIGFERGRPVATDGLVLFIPSATGRSVVDDWCPLVNFFTDDQAAQAWSAERGVERITVPLGEATERATESWKARIRAPRWSGSPTGVAPDRRPR